MSTDADPGYRGRTSYQALLLGGFAMAAAASLVIANIATKDAIEQRRAEDLLASLDQVIPPATHDNDLLAQAASLQLASGQGITLYRALEGKEVTGVAYQLQAQGYGGPIDLLLGVSAAGKILGVRVLAHTETPGLGDHIDVHQDKWILGFDGLSLGNPPAERWAVKKDGGDFDQFSGATITPRAVVGAVKKGLEVFRDNRDALLTPEVTKEASVDRSSSNQSPGGPS
jgi:Na+-translocating ferredoxin:NAD+ oxidoreductase subunit G